VSVIATRIRRRLCLSLNRGARNLLPRASAKPLSVGRRIALQSSRFFSGVVGDNFRELGDNERPEVEKSEEKWLDDLGESAFQVLRGHGTEPPHTHAFNYNKDSGVYSCAGCGTPLFHSSDKYDSGSGWPSFKDNIPGSVVTRTDKGFGMVRTEILCAKCHGHLGHVFNDGPRPTHLRHCVNGLALKFKPSIKRSYSTSTGRGFRRGYSTSLVPPPDAEERKQAKPVVCYEVDSLPPVDSEFYERVRASMKKVDEVLVKPRDASWFELEAGQLFRITSVEGPQVGDLNLWNRDNIREKFYSSKTRQLHATHLTRGDRMWSSFPYLRPMATITHDTLEWYGWDSDGGGVHDVIGSRCDPYTNAVLRGKQYDQCCHSNLVRALVDKGLGIEEAEASVHDVLNVFMCTGFTHDTKQYFMKASPVRPGDFIEFFAEVPLLGALSACPGGDCSASHSDDLTTCYPLLVEIFDSDPSVLRDWKGSPAVSAYKGCHGVQ